MAKVIEGDKDWPSYLPKVYEINNRYTRTLNDTPANIFFARKASWEDESTIRDTLKRFPLNCEMWSPDENDQLVKETLETLQGLSEAEITETETEPEEEIQLIEANSESELVENTEPVDETPLPKQTPIDMVVVTTNVLEVQTVQQNQPINTAFSNSIAQHPGYKSDFISSIDVGIQFRDLTGLCLSVKWLETRRHYSKW